MSTPPSRSQSESFLDAAAMRAATPTSDQPNLPLLFKYNEGHNEMMAHLDENNENDAVRKNFFVYFTFRMRLFRLHPWSLRLSMIKMNVKRRKIFVFIHFVLQE